MRQHALKRALAGISVADAAHLLDAIYQLGAQRDLAVDTQSLIDLLNSDDLSYAYTSSLYEQAKRIQSPIAQMLFSRLTNSEDSDPARSADRELTLGHRKSLARTADRQQLARLLANPEAEVLEILLENPLLTEDDVVLLAARRDGSAELRRLIGQSPRWNRRYRIRRALVLNPSTPLSMGAAMLHFLRRADLRQVTQSGALHQQLRELAADLLQPSDA
ncbi:MAG: hypothetical protein H6707_15105 [Deltaproteobacteria bacterium]|nr:hypothetical protein [Deltaproteobacteria bacterium]